MEKHTNEQSSNTEKLFRAYSKDLSVLIQNVLTGEIRNVGNIITGGYTTPPVLGSICSRCGGDGGNGAGGYSYCCGEPIDSYECTQTELDRYFNEGKETEKNKSPDTLEELFELLKQFGIYPLKRGTIEDTLKSSKEGIITEKYLCGIRISAETNIDTDQIEYKIRTTNDFKKSNPALHNLIHNKIISL